MALDMIFNTGEGSVVNYLSASLISQSTLMTEYKRKKNWFRLLSPAVLAIIFSAIVVIASLLALESSGGWSFIGILIFAPVAGILILLDIIIKLILKNRTLLIWLVELLILGLAYFIWVSKFIYV